VSELSRLAVSYAPSSIVHCNISFHVRDRERRCFPGQRGGNGNNFLCNGAMRCFSAERTAALAVHDALQYYWAVLRDIECKP
jgi:hypothetical protein